MTPLDPVLAVRTVTAYELVIEPIRAAARRCGYAIAVHGSLQRDIDLVAVPWTQDATTADALEAVREVNGGVAVPDDATAKPHGRLAWRIFLGGGPYIDLSVTPRMVGDPP